MQVLNEQFYLLVLQLEVVKAALVAEQSSAQWVGND